MSQNHCLIISKEYAKININKGELKMENMGMSPQEVDLGYQVTAYGVGPPERMEYCTSVKYNQARVIIPLSKVPSELKENPEKYKQRPADNQPLFGRYRGTTGLKAVVDLRVPDGMDDMAIVKALGLLPKPEG